MFDAAFSISSFEHDGLGRYGDPINPDGDLQAMEKTKRMLKPGGLLLLAVPVGCDVIVWNAHRIYGPKRLARLLEGWDILDAFGFNQSLFYINDAMHTYYGNDQPLFVLRAKG